MGFSGHLAGLDCSDLKTSRTTCNPASDVGRVKSAKRTRVERTPLGSDAKYLLFPIEQTSGRGLGIPDPIHFASGIDYLPLCSSQFFKCLAQASALD
jgi:hypothetical protein